MYNVFTWKMDKIIHISSFYLESDVNENYKPHIASQNKMYVANGRIDSDIKKNFSSNFYKVWLFISHIHYICKESTCFSILKTYTQLCTSFQSKKGRIIQVKSTEQ